MARLALAERPERLPSAVPGGAGALPLWQAEPEWEAEPELELSDVAVLPLPGLLAVR